MKLVSFLFLFAVVFSMSAGASVVTYQVPSSDPKLSDYSQFKVDVGCKRKSGVLQVKYSYPAELTGNPVSIKMRQSTFDPSFYYGDHAEMKCQNDQCDVKYENLPVDMTALRSRLQSMSKSPEEFNARMQLALANIGDPGGTFNETPGEYCR